MFSTNSIFRIEKKKKTEINLMLKQMSKVVVYATVQPIYYESDNNCN